MTSVLSHVVVLVMPLISLVVVMVMFKDSLRSRSSSQYVLNKELELFLFLVSLSQDKVAIKTLEITMITLTDQNG